MSLQRAKQFVPNVSICVSLLFQVISTNREEAPWRAPKLAPDLIKSTTNKATMLVGTAFLPWRQRRVEYKFKVDRNTSRHQKITKRKVF
jgi:hypothetical protein